MTNDMKLEGEVVGSRQYGGNAVEGGGMYSFKAPRRKSHGWVYWKT